MSVWLNGRRAACDYRPRKDEALERGYMKGRYGAVPMVGKISG